MELNNPAPRNDPDIGKRQVQSLKSHFNASTSGNEGQLESRDLKNTIPDAKPLSTSPLDKGAVNQPTIGARSLERERLPFDDALIESSRRNGSAVGKRQMLKAVAVTTSVAFVSGGLTSSLASSVISIAAVFAVGVIAYSLGYHKGVYQVFDEHH